MLPNVPTIGELGFGKEKVAPWFALAGPAGVSAQVAQRLRGAFVKAANDTALKRRLEENGTLVATSTSEEMARLMAEEWATMQALVKVLGLRP